MCDVYPAPMLALEHLRASSSMGRALIPEVTRLPLAQPAPMLALEHLRASSSMGRALIPEVTRLPLAQAACQLICQIQDFTSKRRPEDLIRISSNGRVDEDGETETFQEITQELEGIVQASIQLRYAEGTGLPTDTACILTERRSTWT